MSESAELGHRIDKPTTQAEGRALRPLLPAPQGVGLEFTNLVLIGGVDGAGKGETVNLLNEWMDPRHIQTHAFGAPSDEERERPPHVALLARAAAQGQDRHLLRLLVHGADPGARVRQGEDRRARSQAGGHRALRAHARRRGRADRQVLVPPLEEGAAQAAALAREGSTDALARDRSRLEALRPLRQVPQDLGALHPPHLDRQRALDDRRGRRRALPQPDGRQGAARRDARRLSTAAGAVGQPAARRSGRSTAPRDRRARPRPRAPTRTVRAAALGCRRLNARRAASAFAPDRRWRLRGHGRRRQGRRDPPRHRARSTRASTARSRSPRRPTRSARSPTSGASGAICRARAASRSSTAPGTGACWSSASRASAPADWMRAYAEINDFEEQLAQHGTVVVKFWLHISKDEQLRRFEEREHIAYKQHKITAEDWRNREKWDDYESPSATWSTARARPRAVDARERLDQPVQLAAHAHRERLPIGGQIDRLLRREQRRQRDAHRQLAQALPLVEQARVDLAQHRAQVGDDVLDLVGARRRRHRLHSVL